MSRWVETYVPVAPSAANLSQRIAAATVLLASAVWGRDHRSSIVGEIESFLVAVMRRGEEPEE